MPRAIWEGTVIAESADCVQLEGNHYFPPDSLHQEYFRPSTETSRCSWKGTANYYDVAVDGKRNHGAAWYYADPKEATVEIKGRVAFWRGVRVED